MFVECKFCSRQYLYNNETLILYKNAQDLSKTEFNVDEQPSSCLGCENPDWDFRELEGHEIDKVNNGEWHWAY